jgi:hypothetical protein
MVPYKIWDHVIFTLRESSLYRQFSFTSSALESGDLLPFRRKKSSALTDSVFRNVQVSSAYHYWHPLHLAMSNQILARNFLLSRQVITFAQLARDSGALHSCTLASWAHDLWLKPKVIVAICRVQSSVTT